MLCDFLGSFETHHFSSKILYKLVWYSQTNLVIVLHFAILQTQQLTTWANTSLRLLLLTKELHAWSLPIVTC